MTCPEGSSVEIETSLDGVHGANRPRAKFQICSCDKNIAAFFPLQWVNCFFPILVGERKSGSDKLNESRCNSQFTAKQPITAAVTIRIPIGFITYDRIDVIETAVTLSAYLNLCAYRVQCLSATRHTYLI